MEGQDRQRLTHGGGADPGEVTRLLQAASEGDRAAGEELAPLIYTELRGLASRNLRGEARPRTLQTTDLVHEAWMRLAGADVAWESRAHFLRVAARAMRRILVDHARARRAGKRGQEQDRIALDVLADAYQERATDLVALDDALLRLGDLDPLKTHLVELRFFGGLSMEEVSRVLGVSLSSAERHWTTARAWLARALAG